MVKYIFKRTIQSIPMLIIISIISFCLMQMAPGDPSAAYITPKMNAEQIQIIKERLGLNAPIHIQYMKWIKNVLKGDLGFSLIDFRPVSTILIERIPATLSLMGTSLLISLILSIPIGLFTGFKKNTLIDNIISTVSFIGISIPSFWFGIILIYIFSLKLHLLPSVGMHTVGKENSLLDIFQHMIMPCTVLSFYNISIYTRYIRSSTISELKQNYVRTAYAYGFSNKFIMMKYVLKNILLPIITIFCMNLPSLLTGAFVTETVFAWPGMGRLGVNAIFNYDYPVIMSITMLTSILLIVGNLLADILYSIIDPRISNMR
ncbi:MAG: ABC transporter permease [Tepidibacter sp.]|uniref:ABC transporter permease n=1 Tax=Tepidibacter sp. TaxID=2529387 RepID=UPI0025E1E030|nr:ABC transporter permease [Tepidibacter sp.]MCT4509594.1 ABC transporter permease [Tepidibacter sp.]